MKFNETKSQERLINLMLQAGVAWHKDADTAAQDKDGMYLYFFVGKPYRNSGDGYWGGEYCNDSQTIMPELIPNWHQTIITREQYEARDGWITWHGGECPVDGGMVVEVALRYGDRANIPPSKAWLFSWEDFDEDDDIVAYRPHNPPQPQSEVCESVAITTDHPTIEQLIQEWKRLDEIAEKSREIAERDQEAFDRAAEAVEGALKKAGWH